jgi:hypothetical protein
MRARFADLVLEDVLTAVFCNYDHPIHCELRRELHLPPAIASQ